MASPVLECGLDDDVVLAGDSGDPVQLLLLVVVAMVVLGAACFLVELATLEIDFLTADLAPTFGD